MCWKLVVKVKHREDLLSGAWAYKLNNRHHSIWTSIDWKYHNIPGHDKAEVIRSGMSVPLHTNQVLAPTAAEIAANIWGLLSGASEVHEAAAAVFKVLFLGTPNTTKTAQQQKSKPSQHSSLNLDFFSWNLADNLCSYSAKEQPCKMHTSKRADPISERWTVLCQHS